MKFVTSMAFSDPADFCELAKTADECGWEGIVVSEHGRAGASVGCLHADRHVVDREVPG